MVRRAVPTLIALVVAACSFPDVTYSNAMDGSGTDATSQDGSSEAGGDGTADGPGEIGSDERTSDAPADVADEHPFEAAADSPVCDEDQDGDPAKGAACGSTDCDDHDARAYFGEPNFLTYPPTPTTGGDWNCDGVVTAEFSTSFSCGLVNLGSCGSAAGFTDAPGCGQTSSNFVTCKKAGVLCAVDTTTTNIQGCK